VNTKNNLFIGVLIYHKSNESTVTSCFFMT
jgi:hypothetical protein